MTDKCTSPEGHRWTLFGSEAHCSQSGCEAYLEDSEIEAILNAHASLQQVKKAAEIVRDQCASVDMNKVGTISRLAVYNTLNNALLESKP